MSNVFTLDDLRKEVRHQFEPFRLTVSDGSDVILQSPLRLSKEDRKAVSAALEEIEKLRDEENEDEALDGIVEAISKIFTAVCDKPQKLLSELHDDDRHIKVTLMTRVLNEWAKEVQLGEA